MYLPEERETVIRFDELDNAWYFETSVRKHITKIEKRIELYEILIEEQLLEPQLDIGKAVLESMIEIYFRDGALKGVQIPVKFQDKEFIIEVRLKNE